MIDRMTTVMAILVLMLGGSLVPDEAAAAADDEGVKAAVEEFYTALNAIFTGDLSLMKEIWSHADDVTYLGPDGSFEVGWDQVLSNWEKQAAMKLGGQVTPADMHITVGRDLAIVQNFEKGENVDDEGNPLMVSIRATNIFRHEDGQWKMISHQTDLLPFLE